jgi:hypothetical protein
MNAQVKKFFPAQNEVRLLICTKTKGGVLLDGGLYKQGIHFHWPDILVVVDKAMAIRKGIIVGLQGTGPDSTLDWMADIGMKDPPWNTIIDDAVYRPHDRDERSGGLRLIGAPKAKKCNHCPGTIGKERLDNGELNPKYEKEPMCDVCQFKNNKYIIDDNVYLLSDVLINDRPDEQQHKDICKNMKRMFRLTTVRANDCTDETPGFFLFDPSMKADPPPQIQNPKPGSGHKLGKPKVVTKSNSEDKVDGRKIAQFKEITDPEIAKIMRSLLIEHSEKYRDSKMKILFDGKYKYKVLLTNTGAKYCKNKGDYHSQNNVYMEIFKTGSSFNFKCVMKCWSTNPVVYRPSGMTCKCYTSHQKVTVPLNQSERLFIRDANEQTLKDAMNPLIRLHTLEAENKKLLEENAKRRKTATS